MKIRTLAIAAVLVVVVAAAALVMPAVARYGGGEVTGDVTIEGEVPGAGNCLSFPVIWAEGVTKVLRGTPEMVPVLDGEWYYWWGTDPVTGDPQVCPPDPDDVWLRYCDDENPGTTGVDPRTLSDTVYRVYPQQDAFNTWQAGSVKATDQNVDVYVDLIDWGDNLESVDWYEKSKVRTEVVLIEDSTVNSINDCDGAAETYLPMTQYMMRHVSGWGIDELWGLSTTNLPEAGENPNDPPILPEAEEVDPNTQATVYSACARLTIQKLLLERDDPLLENLEWVPGTGNLATVLDGGFWVGEGLINQPIFNKVVYETGDGPGYYSAEINVKGKVMYGYTWDVKSLHDETQVPPYEHPTAAGDYRVTFSLDPYCGSESYPLNTFFSNASGGPVTEILTAAEEVVEEVATLDEPTDPGGDTGGATGVIDYENNLTYIDVTILPRSNNGNGPQPNQ